MARHDEEEFAPRHSRPQPQQSLLFRKRWVVLLGLLGLAWFAPQIVAMTPLLQSTINSAAPELQGRVKVGGASLGWLSPVVLRNIVWHDSEGEVLAQVESMRLDRTVVQLLSNSQDLGTIHLEHPQARVVLRDDGSNLEDALAPLLEQPSVGALPAVTVTIANGQVELIDNRQQLAWQVEEINAKLNLTAVTSEPSQLALQGKVHDSQGAARPIDLNFAWHAISEEPQAGEPGGSLTLKTLDTPLAMLRPVVRRILPGADLQGVATCDVQLAYNADGSQQQLAVRKLEGRDVLFAAPQYTGQEALRSRSLSVSGDANLAGGRLKLTSLQLQSDFASLAADGSLPLAGWDQNARTAAIDALQNEDYLLHGEVDLAKLAALLPETLRIREGTEITAGRLTLDLASQLEGKKRRWTGELKSSQLAALQNGREIIWDEPITITLAAQQAATGPIIERLACVSSFLSLQARGTLEQGELNTTGDLAQLLAEANRFADLDHLRLAGKLEGAIAWQRTAEDTFAAQGQSQVTNFEFVTSGQAPWREPQLTCDLVAAGKLSSAGLTELDSARLRVVGTDEEVNVSLSQPVTMPLQNQVWPITCSVTGDLARWLPRLHSWLPPTIESLAGASTLEAQLVSSPQSLEIKQFKLDVADLKVQSPAINVFEPEVHISGDGAWVYQTQRFTSQNLTVATSALAFRGDALMVEPRGSSAAVSGEIGYRADLERMAQWLVPPGESLTRKIAGMTEGRIVFTHQGDRTQAKWTAEFEDLSISKPRSVDGVIAPVAASAPTWETLWAEPKLSWHGQGEFDHARDHLTATHLNVTSDMISVAARGQIAAITTAPVVDLTGEIAYDLKNVAAIFTAYLGDGLKMSGADKRQFMVRGPLPTMTVVATADARTPTATKLVWPNELVGRAGLGWTTAELYGLPVGEGNLDATLDAGVVNFAPLDVQVADGRLKAWPRLVLGNDPMVFQLAQGTRAEKVEITPQMCQTWLKFVAPLLADATRAEGKFSAEVAGATFPILTPEYGEARGTLSVHGARVGPGPLAEQYVLLATQIRSLLERKPLDPNFRPEAVQWLTLPEQQVQVEMKGGRVYHQGLTILVKDTTLVTSGSVGVDQTLSLLVEIPIREEWIAKDRVLSGLRGQSLKVPIGGTVGRPQLDNRAIEQLAAQLIQNTAGQLLENSLQQGLDKLLRPRP